MGERLLCPLHAAALRAHRERPRDVATELHRDAAALKQSAPVRTALLRLKVVKAAPPSWDLWLPGHPGESRSPEQSPSYLPDKAPGAPTSAVPGSPWNLPPGTVPSTPDSSSRLAFSREAAETSQGPPTPDPSSTLSSLQQGLTTTPPKACSFPI